MENEDQFKAWQELLKAMGGQGARTTVKLTAEDVEFDTAGRIIIKNKELAEQVKRWLEEGESVYLSSEEKGVNLGCLNIGHC